MLVRNRKKNLPIHLSIIFVEINQKVQNSATGALKVHSSNDLNNLERANSTGGRESKN
jgi:hypothetical protein